MLYKLRINTYVKYTTQVNLSKYISSKRSKDIYSKRQDVVKLTTKDDAGFKFNILNRNLCSYNYLRRITRSLELEK